VISIPSTVHGSVTVTGSALLDAVTTSPDGSRTAFVTTTSPQTANGVSAAYQVSVGAPPDALLARVRTEAAAPPPPISEPAARATALDALNTLTHSSNANVRSQAQLVQGLAGVVLGTTDPNGPST
jgi:hypothetical protein